MKREISATLSGGRVEMSSEHGFLALSAADVRELLTLDLAIESQRTAFEELGKGRALLPARLLIAGSQDSVSFCYAARLTPDGGAVCKFGSVNPANTARGLPTISALITVLNGIDGRPVAIMDGTAVTTIRTSAASAVAVQALANPHSKSLAILGSGVQAEAHVRAISRVIELTSVRIWGTDSAQCAALVGTLAEQYPFDVTQALVAEHAVREADVVVGCTTSFDPIIETDWLREGTLVISIGSFAANRCEVAQDLLSRASAVVVDDVDTACEHAGPIVAGIASGLLAKDQLISLGEVIAGLKSARSKPSDIVYYNSVGIGVQDAAAAIVIVAAARASGRGQTVSL
jgi:ornithine cyclodeaminase/alanine dehydrogenase-like protein (mu-crystallin family)